MDHTRVLLLFGGESSEHDVSVSSATNVNNAIDHDKYEVLPCYIDREGRWWLLDSFSDYSNLDTAKEASFSLGRGIYTVTGGQIRVDVILPILHGKNGEDGSVQGLAQLLHIPIVGCDVVASSICMDKVATKEIVAMNNINVVPYLVHRMGEAPANFDDARQKLGVPLFIKPSRAGSSVGVSKVHDENEFSYALALAHSHDDTVLIEQAMTVREIEVAVMGTPPHHTTSTPGEVKPGAEFYSYDDKYAASSTSSISIPAELDEDMAHRISKTASDVYGMIGCSGLARVDFFLEGDDILYLNEVNTLPGFTDISMYPKLWQHDGINYDVLIDKLIGDALRR